MSCIRSVCFDIGGVLTDVALTWDAAMLVVGLDPPAHAFISIEEFPAFRLFQAGQLDVEAYLDELGDFLGMDARGALNVHEHILLRPTVGTLEVIDELRACGIKCGCLSNTNTLHWPVLTNPDRFPNVAALDIQAASQLIGHNKPDPECFRAFEAMAGVKASEILFFEDGPANVAGARACGWNAVRVDPTGGQESQINVALDEFGVRRGEG